MSGQDYHHSATHNTDESAGLINDISSYTFQALLHSGSAYRTSSSHVYYGPAARPHPYMAAQPGVNAPAPSYSVPIRSQVTRHSILTYDQVHEYDVAGNPHQGIVRHPGYVHFSPVIAHQEAPRPAQPQSQQIPPPPQPHSQLTATTYPAAPAIPVMSGRGRKRHASEKALSELKPLSLRELKEDEGSCIICMEDYVEVTESTDEPKREHALQMGCGHVFGSFCLKLWLKGHSTCPTCRREVDYVEEDERAAEMARRRHHDFGARRQRPTIAERHAAAHAMMTQRRRMAVQAVDYSASRVTHGRSWFSADSERREQPTITNYFSSVNNGAPETQALDVRLSGTTVPRGRPEQGNPSPREGQLVYANVPSGADVGLTLCVAAAPLIQQGIQHRHQAPPPMPQRSQSVRQPPTHQRQHSDLSILFNPRHIAQTPPEHPMPTLGGGYGLNRRNPYLPVEPPPPVRSPISPQFDPPERTDRVLPMFPSLIAHPQPQPQPQPQQRQPQQQPHQVQVQLPSWATNDNAWLPASNRPPAMPIFNPESAAAATATPTAPASPPPPPRQQCDFLDLGFCIYHHYYGTSAEAASIMVALSCGHAFHNICLASTTKSRDAANYPGRRCWCVKCGRFEALTDAPHGYDWAGMLGNMNVAI